MQTIEEALATEGSTLEVAAVPMNDIAPVSSEPDIIGSGPVHTAQIFVAAAVEGAPKLAIIVKHQPRGAHCPYIGGARGPQVVQAAALRGWIFPAPLPGASDAGVEGQRV